MYKANNIHMIDPKNLTKAHMARLSRKNPTHFRY